MSLKINYNASAIVANNSLKMSDNRLTASLERLSSGYKINHAKDNAAGLAIARRMNAQIRGLEVAEQDALDGVSVLEISDGALSEVHDMLQRMNELSIKSATGSITDEDRLTIQAEVAQLKDEIARIGETTEYNGRNLFDGTFDLKGYTDTTEIKVNYFSDTVDPGNYSFELTGLTFEADDTVTPGTTAVVTRTDVNPPVSTPVTVTGDTEQLILKGEKDYEIRIGLEDGWNANGNDINITMELTSMGPMTLQIGANEGQTIDIRIPEVSLLNIGIRKTDVSTVEGANKAIDEIKNGISYISQMRSRMGAYQNRLEKAYNVNKNTQENTQYSETMIRDTDMAKTMVEYSNHNILLQAGQSILSQMNNYNQGVLQLLQ